MYENDQESIIHTESNFADIDKKSTGLNKNAINNINSYNEPNDPQNNNELEKRKRKIS